MWPLNSVPVRAQKETSWITEVVAKGRCWWRTQPHPVTDYKPFFRAALGNSLLCSQQVKLLHSKFRPCYANPCKLGPIPPLSQTAMDGSSSRNNQVPDSSDGQLSLAQGAWLQLQWLISSFACIQETSLKQN